MPASCGRGDPRRRDDTELDLAGVETDGVLDAHSPSRFHHFDGRQSRSPFECRLESKPLGIERPATFAGSDPNGHPFPQHVPLRRPLIQSLVGKLVAVMSSDENTRDDAPELRYCRRHLEKSLFAPVTNVTVLG